MKRNLAISSDQERGLSRAYRNTTWENITRTIAIINRHSDNSSGCLKNQIAEIVFEEPFIWSFPFGEKQIPAGLFLKKSPLPDKTLLLALDHLNQFHASNLLGVLLVDTFNSFYKGLLLDLEELKTLFLKL